MPGEDSRDGGTGWNGRIIRLERHAAGGTGIGLAGGETKPSEEEGSPMGAGGIMKRG